MHGGRAPQVEARRQQRIIEAEARSRGESPMPRDPGDALLSAAHDADTMLQRLKVDIAAGTLAPAQLMAFGDWIDRVARIAKTVLDARIDERKVKIGEQQGQLLAGGLRWWTRQVGLESDVWAREQMAYMLRELAEGRVPVLDLMRPAALVVGEVVR